MAEQGDAVCALCARLLGTRREKHHLVPRSFGGRDTVDVHPICHRKIHNVFTTRELALRYSSMDSLRAHPEIDAFVAWVAGKPPDFHKATRATRGRRKR